VSSIRVRVPATSANLGPGFDCLALSLQLHNEVEMHIGGSGVQVEIRGEGADALPSDERNLVAAAALRAFDEVGFQPDGLRISTTNRIPLGSGLGSSAAAILAGLLGANALAGDSLSDADILSLASELEGHADNAAAALSGGLVAVRTTPDEILVRTLMIADTTVCVVVPDIDMPTAMMRDALPPQVPMTAAVINQASLVRVVEALREGNFELLSAASVDQLHEPYRLPQIPGAISAVQAGLQAGAAAVVLSGAGPGLLAFAAGDHEQIGRAMAGVFAKTGLGSQTLILPIERSGAQINAFD
jgi:homoserine kinase